MKFGKAYSELIYDPLFPSEWRDKAVDYRQLKKLINQIVQELVAMGLDPDALQRLLGSSNGAVAPQDLTISAPAPEGQGKPSAIYEVQENVGDSPIPQLRLHIPRATDGDLSHRLRSLGSPEEGSFNLQGDCSPKKDLSSSLPASPTGDELNASSSPTLDRFEEVIVPLSSDATFLHILSQALRILSKLYADTLQQGISEVRAVAESVSKSAKPQSEKGVSDLNTWRAIFQLWIESEIFESLSEQTHGELPIAEAELRLERFAHELETRNLMGSDVLKLPESRAALKRFLALNLSILNLKKFQVANAEATRKILKKHEKRTSLPSESVVPSLILTKSGSLSLPHALVCDITHVLLPVIPSIDDYLCLICTSIAFKPIRLDCGHLFCVRCLVKMQKKVQPEFNNCPLCRAPVVFKADKRNLDVALMNFMGDWFPQEARIKAKENGNEVANERAAELGLDNGPCAVM